MYNKSNDRHMMEGRPLNIESQTIAPHQDVTQFDRNLHDLERIGALQDNWNGYGAPKVQVQLLDRVRKFLHVIPRHQQPVTVVPTGRGTIQVEYKEQNGKYLELDIGSDLIDILYQPLDGDEIEEENASADRAIDIIQRYYAG